MSTSIADIRTDYKRHTLDEQGTAANPLAQFQVWFDEARNSHVIEPNAMTLATANADGKPSARIVLLKGVTEVGFVFFTNYESHKGAQLQANPYAALVFFWPELERQVRIEGQVEKVPESDSYEYFTSRPFESQIGAWASHQSSVIPNREVLEHRFSELQERYKDGGVPLPPFWGGYVLTPTNVEFWQGRSGRLHDRILYSREETGNWRKERLSP